jgi:small subunit ribosomal protein S17
MKKKEKSEKKISEKEEKAAGAGCKDKDCPVHGNLRMRGRNFEGKVIRKFPKRIVIEFERTVYIRKYERYQKSRTKIHARLPDCMNDKVSIGDWVRVRECRPLSKIIHFVVTEKIRDAESKENKK